jgi:CRP-like cAMP-binding protein
MNAIESSINSIVNPRYEDMGVEGRQLLSTLLVKKELKKGEILFAEGEVCHSIVFVVKGLMRQYYYKNGDDVTEHFSYEGSVLICIESFLKQEPTRLIAEALEPCEVYLLSYDTLRQQIVRSWEINTFYRKILEESLITSQQKADSMRFETAVDRYLELMKRQPEVIRRAPLSYIASYLLMTPETLSRVRAQVIGKS